MTPLSHGLRAVLILVAAAALAGCPDPQVSDWIPPDDDFDPGPSTSTGGYGSGDGGTQHQQPDGGTQDPCADVTCEEWQQCLGGTCRTKDGRCATSDDCASGQTCNRDTHLCQAEASSCDGVTCSSHGVCTEVDGQAVCNCEHGFRPDGVECVPETNIPGWCGIQWVGADNGDIDVEVGYSGPDNKVYGQLYIANQTGGTKPEIEGVQAQLGYTTQPSVGYPVIASEFTWVDAQFNASCTACGNNHEYIAEFPTAAPGTFQFIFRFTTNGGESWFYCDKTPHFITSATNEPGAALVGGGGTQCGGAICPEWKECVNDACQLKAGRCEQTSDCTGQFCDQATHSCTGNTSDPRLELVSMPTVTADGYQFQVRYSGADELDLASSTITLNGTAVDLTGSYDQRVFSVSASGLADGKYTYLFRMKDTQGKRAKALYVPIWIEQKPFDWRDAFLYQIMTDRFLDADNQRQSAGVELAKDWQGGDFNGIRQKIEDGYFEQMGVNALWISSPILNTDGWGVGADGTRYSGYHSYWPIATGWTDTNPLPGITSPIDPHFGTEAELRALVQTAHAHGIRIVVDFVANHVFGITNATDATGTESPLWTEYRDDGWFFNPTNPYVCGWDRPIDCWFRNYLPDFDYDNPAVMQAVMDHAIWMIQEYDFDGFRLDAVKHMVMRFTTTIRSRVKTEVETTGIPFYMVGETFDGDRNKLAEYVGADKLDGQFDFGFYFNVRDNILGGGSLQHVKSFCDANDTFYTQRWSGSLMSNFLSNHDVERALRSAGGVQGAAYMKLRAAQTVLMTSPAIPLVYQGDDIGMDGGGDPDNRRMMRFTGLSADESSTLDHVRRLGRFRAQHAAVRSGTRATCGVGTDHWVYTMTLGNDLVVVGVNRGASEATVTCAAASGTFVNPLRDPPNDTVTLSGSVTVPARSSVVLARQ